MMLSVCNHALDDWRQKYQKFRSYALSTWNRLGVLQITERIADGQLAALLKHACDYLKFSIRPFYLKTTFTQNKNVSPMLRPLTHEIRRSFTIGWIKIFMVFHLTCKQWYCGCAVNRTMYHCAWEMQIPDNIDYTKCLRWILTSWL